MHFGSVCFPALGRHFSWLHLIFYITHRINGHKGIRVGFCNIVHQLPIFSLVYNGNNFPLFFLGISTNGLVHRGAAVQAVENEVTDFFSVLSGYNADSTL